MQKLQNVSELFHNGKFMKYNPPRIVLKTDYVRQDGTCAVYMQVIIQRKKKAIPLSIFVKPGPAFFDKESGYVKGKGDKISDENLIISNALSKATEIFTDYRLRRITLTVEQFIEEYTCFELRNDFLAFFDKNRKQRLKDGIIVKRTYDQNGYTYAKLKAFKSEVKFSDLTCELLNSFNRYMIRGDKDKEQKPNNESTRSKDFSNLKIYVRLALKANPSMQDPFDGFEMPKLNDRIVFLTKEELKLIWDYYFSSEIIEGHIKPLRAFLWMVFSSLRVADCFLVDHKMIHDNLLVFTPDKNKRKKPNPISIPLHEMARNFIETEEGKLMTKIAPQKCNEAYKEVAKKLGINKNISNHVARHTFATQFIINGGSVVALNKILDHSTMEQTMVYVHIVDSFKTQESNKVFDNFFDKDKIREGDNGIV